MLVKISIDNRINNSHHMHHTHIHHTFRHSGLLGCVDIVRKKMRKQNRTLKVNEFNLLIKYGTGSV